MLLRSLFRRASCFEVGHSDAIGIVIVSMVMNAPYRGGGWLQRRF